MRGIVVTEFVFYLVEVYSIKHYVNNFFGQSDCSYQTILLFVSNKHST